MIFNSHIIFSVSINLTGNQYELELMEVAYYLHNLFYKKLKSEYQKIDYDKLLNEARNSEKEMDVLELREMKLKMI